MSFLLKSARHNPELTTPIDLLVSLLWQPARQKDGVAADIDAARRRNMKTSRRGTSY